MTIEQLRTKLQNIPFHDIAELARVSPITVYNSREGRSTPTPETVDRLQKAIQQYKKAQGQSHAS